MYSFVNPYNFVPMGNDSPETTDKVTAYRGEDNQKKLLSGWLDVSMHIKTPLIIPDGAHPRYLDLRKNQYVNRKNDISGKNDGEKKKNLHSEYDFLKLYNPKSGKQEFAVSGSELRGLIRSTYETVTNSCLPFLMDDKPMSQRVPLYGALKKRGLLGYDGKSWILYDTTKELEEVVVIPLYEANGNYYIESLDVLKNNEDNNMLDENGDPKYYITTCWDCIENSLKGYKPKGKQITCNAVFTKCSNANRKWDIKVSGKIRENGVAKNIVQYLFVNAEGKFLEDDTGTFVKGRGWLQYNVPVDTSHVYHIAYLTKGDEVHRWQDSSPKGNESREKKEDMLYAEAYKKLKSALYRDGASGKNTNNDCNQALRQALERACTDKNVFVPVYYFKVHGHKDKEIVYMSGSAAGRIAQRRKWEEIMQGHTPCGNKLCPACLLFGTIKDGGMKGHVRFTDAFLTEPDKAKTSCHTLRVLASPRTTAFEFYLKKPVENATYWNYDFYGVTEGDDAEKSHTNYYHLDKAMPRGRKMYWHHATAPDDDGKSNLNNTLESLNEGEFTFKIFFDQISEKQLQDLIWTVELGDNSQDSKLQYKIGHAKPLGYGSVKLLVAGGTIRSFTKDGQSGAFKWELKDVSKIGIDLDKVKPSFDLTSESVKKLLIMADIEAVAAENVDYPRTDSNGPIYGWFSENRTNAKRLLVLPEPDADNLSLGERPLKKGDIVEAEFVSFAEKDSNYRYGIFVLLPGNVRALMHKKNAQDESLGNYEGKRFQVKIQEITEDKKGKKYSVTDKL